MKISKPAEQAWEKTKEIVTEAWSDVKSVSTDLWDITKKQASEFWDITKDQAIGFWNGTKETFTELGETLVEIGNDTKNIFVDSINESVVI